MKSRPPGYDASFFHLTKKVEKNHFWYVTRRKWILDRLRKFYPPHAKVLEIGCGTGNISSFLSEKGYDATGCEYYQEAIEMAWPGFTAVRGDARDLPFDDNSFDIVGLFDVIEHFDNDIIPLKEATRVVRKNGIVTITVPAKQELWSYTDERSFHKRRYSKEALKNTILQSGLMILSIEHTFMSLYLPMKYTRAKQIEPQNQFKISHSMNTFLKVVFNFERIISRWMSLPIGTSLIAIAKKK